MLKFAILLICTYLFGLVLSIDTTEIDIDFHYDSEKKMTEVDKNYPVLYPNCDVCARLRVDHHHECDADYWKNYMGCDSKHPGRGHCDEVKHFPKEVKVEKGKIIKRKKDSKIEKSIEDVLKKKDDLIAYLKTDENGKFKATFTFYIAHDYSNTRECLVIVLRFKGNDDNRSEWKIKLYHWQHKLWNEKIRLSENTIQKDDNYGTYYEVIRNSEYIRRNGKFRIMLETKNNKPEKELMELDILQIPHLKTNIEDDLDICISSVISNNQEMIKVDKDYPELFPQCDACAEIRDKCTVDFWKDYMGCGCENPGNGDCRSSTHHPQKVVIKSGKIIKEDDDKIVPDKPIEKILKDKDDRIAYLKTNKKGEFKAVFTFKGFEGGIDFHKKRNRKKRGYTYYGENFVIIIRFKGYDNNKSPWKIKIYDYDDRKWQKFAKLSEKEVKKDDVYTTYYKITQYHYGDYDDNGLKLMIETKNNKANKELMKLNVLQVTELGVAHDDGGIYGYSEPCDEPSKTCE